MGLPAWVPPETRTLSPAATEASSSRAACGVSVPSDPLVEAVCLQHELANVDRHVPTGDVGGHDVQAGTVGRHRVDQGRAHVDPTAGAAQHSLDQLDQLDQLGQLPGAEDRRRQLTAPPAGGEHPARLVDPELTRDAWLRAVIDEIWT